MGQRLTTEEGVTAIFDSTSGWAFGPVFSSVEEANDFLKHAESYTGTLDLRGLAPEVLERYLESYWGERGDSDSPLLRPE